MPDRIHPRIKPPAAGNRAAPGGDLRGSATPPFEHVVERHGPALLRFCAAQAGAARAEDVFQEAMLGALRAYGQVRDPAAVRGWLFSIAARKAVDAHRYQARRPEPVADLDPSSAVAPDVAFADDGIWVLVRRLPHKQRLAVTLRYLGDLSHREIAEVMHTSEAAGRRNVFEGLAGLRARIEPRPDGDAP